MTTTTETERTATDQYAALGVRPEAELFPLMEGPEFDALMEDMRVNGQRVPIVVHPDDNCVLDGRNRERARVLLGFKPMTVTWEGPPGTELAYVASCNVLRRHLDTSGRACRRAVTLPAEY
jgi:hypothetical protein